VTAGTEKEIENVVMKVTRKQQQLLINQKGIDPSLSIEEAKQYLGEVLIEMKKSAGDSSDHG
jgi:hypothetical protein